MHDVERALGVLSTLPDAIRTVYPKAATIRYVLPLASRAIGLRDRQTYLASGDAAGAVAALFSDALDVLGKRYSHLAGEYRRLAGVALAPDKLDDAIVGQGGGALTAAVAAALRNAWPIVREGAKKLAGWIVRNKKTAALAVPAAGAAPGVYRAGRSLGRAAASAAGGIEKAARFAGGLGGVGMLLLVFLFLTRRRS
jgi:hypothetical protein